MYEWGLIDLKRLHDDVEYWEQHDDPKQPDYDTRDIERVIGDQPIVEAIPVEWLDTYCTDSDIGLRDNDPIAIKKLLKDWRNENEKTEEN